MKEFCQLIWDEPIFPDKFAQAVFSNTDGNIVGYSDNEELLNEMLEILDESGARDDIAKEGSGMERIFSGMFGVGGSYSSDNGFTENEFIQQSKTLKFKKEIKIK